MAKAASSTSRRPTSPRPASPPRKLTRKTTATAASVRSPQRRRTPQRRQSPRREPTPVELERQRKTQTIQTMQLPTTYSMKEWHQLESARDGRLIGNPLTVPRRDVKFRTTIVFDVDETLLSTKRDDDEISDRGVPSDALPEVILRPGVREMFAQFAMSPNFRDVEIGVWSAGGKDHVTSAVNALDPFGLVIQFAIYRDDSWMPTWSPPSPSASPQRGSLVSNFLRNEHPVTSVSYKYLTTRSGEDWFPKEILEAALNENIPLKDLSRIGTDERRHQTSILFDDYEVSAIRNGSRAILVPEFDYFHAVQSLVGYDETTERSSSSGEWNLLNTSVIQRILSVIQCFHEAIKNASSSERLSSSDQMLKTPRFGLIVPSTKQMCDYQDFLDQTVYVYLAEIDINNGLIQTRKMTALSMGTIVIHELRPPPPPPPPPSFSPLRPRSPPRKRAASPPRRASSPRARTPTTRSTKTPPRTRANARR